MKKSYLISKNGSLVGSLFCIFYGFSGTQNQSSEGVSGAVLALLPSRTTTLLISGRELRVAVMERIANSRSWGSAGRVFSASRTVQT